MSVRIKGSKDYLGDGVVLTKSMMANYARIPAGSAATYNQATMGTSTITNASSAVTNTDGSNRNLQIVVPALAGGAMQQGAWIEETIWGPKVGVRFRRDNSASNPPFTVSIDGVPYEVSDVNARRHSTRAAFSDYECPLQIADDLGPGPHTVRVAVAAAPVGGASRTLVFYGFLGDRSAGYDDKPRRGVFPAGSMTASPTSSTSLSGLISSPTGGIRKIVFHNGDAGSQTFTVQLGSDTIHAYVLAAGADAEHDFGEAVTPGSVKIISTSANIKYGLQEGS